jgi:molybdate transport system permease protein
MYFSIEDLAALSLSFELALFSTTFLLVIAVPLAFWLSRTQSPFRFIVESLVALPLVLPPTVLGFYLLLFLGAQGLGGQLLGLIGAEPWAFTFKGLVLGSMLYSLPFVVQPLQESFSAISSRHLEIAASMGASKIDRLLTVIFPLSRAGFITAAMLGFAHTLGEFGVVLMLGGNIAGQTRVLSIQIYDHVEQLEYAQAHALSALMLFLSFSLLVLIYFTRAKLRVRTL